MKNLITSIACIMILLVFVLQFTQNQVIHNQITAADQAINNFKEIIKQDGCVTIKNEKFLKNQISRILSCSEEEIAVKGDRKPVYRGNKIHYSVEIPIRNLISASSFWDISDESNTIDYITDRYTTSEYIGR